MTDNIVTHPEVEEIVGTAAEPATEHVIEPEKAAAPAETEYVDEMGVIGPYTKLEGDIVTKGSISVSGHVVGNITAAGDVIISGVVNGRIACRNAYLLEDSSVEAEITAQDQVSVEENVEVFGPIIGENITIKGSVEGDLKACSTVSLAATSVVKGNITAANFAVGLGAKIQGTIAIG